MGSRSRLFSDGEMDAAALLSPHCFPKCPSAAHGHLYRLRAAAIESGGRRGTRVVDWVTRMNKIYAAGLSMVVSRAGDANARKPA